MHDLDDLHRAGALVGFDTPPLSPAISIVVMANVSKQDIFTVAPTAVPGTVSLLTLVGGEIVWNTGAIAPQP